MNKVTKKLKKYWLEIIFITISLILAVVSLTIFQQTTKENEEKTINELPKIEDKILPKMYVDVSGSVNNPGLYEASNSSRVKHMVDLAGGLSDAADRDFFARNFNLASLVSDQDKIYVPSIWEVSMGYFMEGQSAETTVDRINKVNINEATLEELDTLPGVGRIIGQKIIDNRPYEALQELIDKKVISENLLEKLEELIET